MSSINQSTFLQGQQTNALTAKLQVPPTAIPLLDTRCTVGFWQCIVRDGDRAR
jgi:hypothetical protein